MIFVVNKHKHFPTANDIYIGRGSPLGNPYTHIKEGTKAEFIVSDRDEAIKNYETYINDKILNKDPNICNILNKIWLMAKNDDVNLSCFCKPKSCHGDIIKKIIEGKL
jgi:hypothetical protein